MIALSAYRDDPCGKLSIPYWKSKSISVPPHMKIVHQREFDDSLLCGYADELYFRLMHDLKSIEPAENSVFSCRSAGEDDLPLMVDLINRSYRDLSVTETQLRGYRNTAAFAPDLWIIAYDTHTQSPVGCGIADFDPEAREGVLEWIQALPEHRRRGVGQFIVNELLRRMACCADFATVSGKVNHPSCPERLYRKCGFTGDDVWHVMSRK